MPQSEIYATIHQVDLEDTKPKNNTMVIDKYARGWFEEEVVKGHFLSKVSSITRNLRMDACLRVGTIG